MYLATMQLLIDYASLLIVPFLLLIKYVERSASWYFNKGMFYLNKKQYPKAKLYLENALKRRHNYIEARFALAELHRRRGDNKMAQVAMSQAFRQSQLSSRQRATEIRKKGKNLKTNSTWPSAKIWPSTKTWP